MTPLISDTDFTLHVGDVRDVLRELPAESVHCVVTSPPYWGLRDYGTGSWEGGDPGCDHLGEPFRTKSKLNENWGAGYTDVKNAADRQPMGQTCSKCGASRVDRQIGLEATPDEYVQTMVDVFREVRRVLRRDGTCWVNLGDSYATNGSAGGRSNTAVAARRQVPGFRHARYLNRAPAAHRRRRHRSRKTWSGSRGGSRSPSKQTAGTSRSDIVWAKPNPMPESVTDRPTKAHEYVFLLTRSPRYFFDQEAVREAGRVPAAETDPQRLRLGPRP